MVFYFDGDDGAHIYMGKDKFENESLIKYGWEEDIWFHVDNLSSAHVYIRLQRGPIRKIFLDTGNLDHCPMLLKQCCQLVKQNSIEGCKKSAVDIFYTPWENLLKTGNMDDGQVGFKDKSKVVKIKGVEKDRDILKAIEKTRRESYPDLEKERADHEAEILKLRKEKQKKEAIKEKEEQKKRKEENERKDLKHLMKEELMKSNEDMESSKDTSAAVNYEEGFM